MTLLRNALAAFALLAVSLGANAQLFRAYLASDGNDANPCTLAAPCRLLPAALAAVINRGEIWLLDSANYNTTTVTIDKHVTILAVPGALGSLVTNNAHAIVVIAPNARVVLRNLVVTRVAGTSGAWDGIRVEAAATSAMVWVENCVVTGVSGAGIHMASNGRMQVSETAVRNSEHGIRLTNGSTSISRTQVTGNVQVGIHSIPDAGTNVKAFIDNTVASFNSYGVVASGGTAATTRIHVSQSVASGNTFDGMLSVSGGAPSDSMLEVSGSVVSGNAGYGFQNNGASFTSAKNNVVSRNALGDTQGLINTLGLE